MNQYQCIPNGFSLWTVSIVYCKATDTLCWAALSVFPPSFDEKKATKLTVKHIFLFTTYASLVYIMWVSIKDVLSICVCGLGVLKF